VLVAPLSQRALATTEVLRDNDSTTPQVPAATEEVVDGLDCGSATDLLGDV
jgi:hypothetical protein